MNIILTIPHSSTYIPENMIKDYEIAPESILKNIDYGVDRIYEPFKYPKIVAGASRFVVDLNRKRDDLSSDQGVIIRKDWHGNNVWKKYPEDTESLLSQYYDPFYSDIDMIKPNSFVWDCHSMDSQGNKGGGDHGTIRPDICIATGEYSLCPKEIVMKIKELFELEGYDVKIDYPYKGLKANIMKRVLENGSIGVEFEIAKRAYMDEDTLVLDDAKIERLRRVLNDTFDYISSIKEDSIPS
ncbi:MAG: N-formylglutamate amidohydrolase [Candidatus Woesearchaeota archaeon]